MKKSIMTLLLLQVLVNSYGQINNMAKNPPGIPTKKELDEERRNHNCIRRYKKTFSTRLKNYPFNKASQIRLISYLAQPVSKDNPDRLSRSGIPIENDTICYSKLEEIKNLTLKQIDTLTDILFNIGFRGVTYTLEQINCYEPRNGILFLNPDNITFEYIEVCFGCNKTKQSSDRIELGELCEQKFDILKKFFLSAGIKYGTSEQETD
jgi:hypothetical protein